MTLLISPYIPLPSHCLPGLSSVLVGFQSLFAEIFRDSTCDELRLVSKNIFGFIREFIHLLNLLHEMNMEMVKV